MAKNNSAVVPHEAQPTTPPPADVLSGLKTVHESPPNPSKQIDPPTQSREELREQASKFLESSAVKNAPLSEKREFLLEKGLTAEDIEVLMQELERTEKEKSKGTEKEKHEATTALEEGRQKAEAAVGLPKPRSEVAPLITYPEFLTPAPQPPPPPLVSVSNLFKSVYFGTAIASTVYGAHKFVFTPMFDALTSARLELSSTAIKNLTELNSRLRDLAPETTRHPATAASSHYHHHSGDSDSSSSSSSTSDPSEMFHVDAMTQTSPRPSVDFGPDEEYMTPDSKLEHLSTQLHALVTSHSDGTDKELTVALKDLRVYLEGLVLEYDWPGSNIHLPPHEWIAAATKEKDKDDPVAKLKAEIRSVKGVMLNTKNFPSSR